ncbi:MAG: protein kinase, partial [Myxococcales bacterium]|nr:protein kinase [Myxococcales bacterium]
MIRKLEKYEILEEIGHGGMATVYEARDTRLERRVAIKILHPHLRRSPEARRRFTREAKSVARLRHPNILEIYDYSGEDSEESYIAAELLTGPTLKVLVEEGRELPAEFAACMALQIAEALAAAHQSGIVHRDVKPENVLLHENRCLKLTDFGIAQMVDAQGFTATGQILGSPGHMAPEQIEGGAIDARTDVFALGTVLYYLALGRLPYTGRNPHQVLKRIMDADYPDPLRVRPSIGETLRGIILRAMALDPAERYQNAAEFSQDLREFVARAGIEDPAAALERYLLDPEEASETLRRAIVERYVSLAQAASRRGERAEALRLLDRVLALDEGNEAALALVERIAARPGHRWIYLVAAGALLGLGALAYDSMPWSPDGDSLADAGLLGAPSDAGGGDAEGGADALTPPPPDASEAPPADAGARLPDARASDPDASAPRIGLGMRRIRPPNSATNAPRLVRFRPSPANVSVRIDGAPPRAYGPSFQEISLPPGPHTFVFESPTGCCESRTLELRIPPGEEPYLLRATLPFRPARLIVSTSVPATVSVQPGAGEGVSGRNGVLPPV